jgi:hypothetical protein
MMLYYNYVHNEFSLYHTVQTRLQKKKMKEDAKAILPRVNNEISVLASRFYKAKLTNIASTFK